MDFLLLPLEMGKSKRFLGVFAKFQKVTISFLMSVCPHRTTRLPLDGFLWNLIFEYFLKKNCQENSCFIKIRPE